MQGSLAVVAGVFTFSHHYTHHKKCNGTRGQISFVLGPWDSNILNLWRTHGPTIATMWNDAMDAALSEARSAIEHEDVPVGAVLLDSAGRVVASDHNRREQHSDPTAHAEMLVLSTAARSAGDWRLEGHTLVVTLEPCAMCAGAAVHARVERIVYGTADLKAGAAWSLFNIPQDKRLNHHIELVAGVRENACAAVLTEFFETRR